MFTNFLPENHAGIEIVWKRKYGTAGQATDRSIIRRMRFQVLDNEALQTHIQNTLYLLLLHLNIGCTNSSQCYIFAHVPSLVLESSKNSVNFSYFQPNLRALKVNSLKKNLSLKRCVFVSFL